MDRIYPKIKNWKDIDEHSVRTLIEKYGGQRVFASYAQTKEDAEITTIQSKGRYFYNFIHNSPTLFEDRKKLEEEGQEKEAKQQETAKKKVILNERRKKLNKDLNKVKQGIEKDIELNHPEIYEKVIEESKKHHAYDSKMTWEENIKRPFFSYYPSTIMKKMLPSKYEKVNEIQSKIEELEKQERSM